MRDPSSGFEIEMHEGKQNKNSNQINLVGQLLEENKFAFEKDIAQSDLSSSIKSGEVASSRVV